MKWFIGIALVVSLGVNIYFTVEEITLQRNLEFGKLVNKNLGGGKLTNTTWKQGLELFTKALKTKNRSLLNKKYYYINIWASFCAPCIREMPWLDTIADTLRKDVGYVFLSDMSDEVADKCIKRKNFTINNFVFLNDMNEFVSAICNERGVKNKAYPMVLILSNKGELLHYSVGAYGNVREAAGFAEIINRLD